MNVSCSDHTSAELFIQAFCKLQVNGEWNCTSLVLLFGVVKCEMSFASCAFRNDWHKTPEICFAKAVLFMIYFKMCDIICPSSDCCDALPLLSAL